MLAIERTQYNKDGWRKSKQLLLIGMLLSIIAMTIILLGLLSSDSLAKPVTTDYKYEPVIIQKGDTLWGLTAKHNTQGDINQLVNRAIRYNNLKSSFIEPGQIIYIPIKNHF